MGTGASQVTHVLVSLHQGECTDIQGSASAKMVEELPCITNAMRANIEDTSRVRGADLCNWHIIEGGYEGPGMQQGEHGQQQPKRHPLGRSLP